MPTKKTRIQLSAPDDLVEALEALSLASGSSKAGICVELLIPMIPAIHQLAKAYEIAKKSPLQALDELESTVQQATIQGAQVHLDLQDKRNQFKARKRKTKR